MSPSISAVKKCSQSTRPKLSHLHPHLGTSTNSSVVATEGNTLLLQGHILQVLGGLADVHALDGLGSLTSVLKHTVTAPFNASSQITTGVGIGQGKMISP